MSGTSMCLKKRIKLSLFPFALIPFLSAAQPVSLPVNSIDSGKVTANKGKLTLLGNSVKLGDQAPNFKAANNKFSPISLNDFQGKAVLISTVPSLDTGICSLQTKHFNDKIATKYPNVVMLTVSMDLPFAQSRFCKSENITQLYTLSDAVWREFASKYGLLIQDMGLLARSVLILDESHRIIYKQLVPNLAKEPDYISVEAALKKMQDTKSESQK